MGTGCASCAEQPTLVPDLRLFLFLFLILSVTPSTSWLAGRLAGWSAFCYGLVALSNGLHHCYRTALACPP